MNHTRYADREVIDVRETRHTRIEKRDSEAGVVWPKRLR